MHNYFTNYHTPTCFDTIVSSSGSLYLVPCQGTQVFQMQKLVTQFKISHMFYAVEISMFKSLQYIKTVLFTIKRTKIILLLQIACSQSVWWLYIQSPCWHYCCAGPGCYINYLNTCTVHLLLFCTVTHKCTIISQIITLLHVSTLSCHPQTACNQYFAKLHKYFKCSCW